MKNLIISVLFISSKLFSQENINKIDQILLSTLQYNKAENVLVLFKNIETPQESLENIIANLGREENSLLGVYKLISSSNFTSKEKIGFF